MHWISGWRSPHRSKLRGAREIGKKIGIFYDEALLGDAVEQLGLLQILLLEAVIENSVARANHRFGRTLLGFSEAPGQANPRRQTAVVVDSILPFVAQAVVDGNIGTNAPFVLCVKAEIAVSILRHRIALSDGKQAGAAADRAVGRSAAAVRANLHRSKTCGQVLLGDLVRG